MNIKFVREAIESALEENKINHKNLLNELTGVKRGTGGNTDTMSGSGS
jgi:hypothetical protein